jgi:hypothetical protein
MNGEVDPIVSDDYFVAIHEAGHGVVAVLSGVAVNLLAIVDEPDTAVDGFASACDDYAAVLASFASREFEPPIPPTRNGLGLLAVKLAGGIAEAKARGTVYCPGMSGSWHDRFTAEHVAGRLLHQPAVSAWVRGVLATIEGHTTALVSTNWNWIESVARELVGKRRLSGDEVRALRPGRLRRTA